MLKITGIENGTLKDEKILIDYDGQLTTAGKVALVGAGFSLIGIISVLLFLTKPFRGKKPKALESAAEAVLELA